MCHNLHIITVLIIFMKAEDSPIGGKASEDKIRGVLWGAVLGDVIGAYLEFNRSIDEAKVQEAFKVKGGGMHKLEPGQPTDDSELAYSIGKGLVRGKGELNLNIIAEEMGNWFLSKPIDVGGTIRNSVPKACNMKVHQAHLCRKGASQNSQTSQSNGTLMALAPLSIWCHRLSPPDIIKAIKQFTILIHPCELVVLCNTFYTLMLTYFLSHASENQSVRQDSFAYARAQIAKHVAQSKEKKEFQRWISFVEESLKDPAILTEQLSPVKKSGWVRIAFTYAIHYLLANKSFKESLANILRLKGDTDTNACIAGGLMGSYYGFQSIETEFGKQIEIIQTWRPKNVKRPEWLVPGLVVDKLAANLEKISPKQLKIIGGTDQYKK